MIAPKDSKCLDSLVQLVIKPSVSGHKQRICGETSLNLSYFIQNFLNSELKKLGQNSEKISYRQRKILTRCPDKEANVQLELAITSKKLKESGLMRETNQQRNSSISSMNDTSMMSIKSFSKVSWINPKSSRISKDK